MHAQAAFRNLATCADSGENAVLLWYRGAAFASEDRIALPRFPRAGSTLRQDA